jgi:hypothetical protein
MVLQLALVFFLQQYPQIYSNSRKCKGDEIGRSESGIQNFGQKISREGITWGNYA